jgi:O-phosphoseryl-tRNA(Sec) kinase
MDEGAEVVVVDDNMYYKSMRKQIYRLCCEKKVKFVQVLLDVNVETCVARNSLRTGAAKIPEEIVRRMETRLERPTGKKWDVALVVEENVGEVEVVQKLLSRAMECRKVEKKEKEQETQTSKHQADLLMRKEISRRVEEADGSEEKQRVAQKLNGVRKLVLQSKSCSWWDDFEKQIE